MKKCKMTVSGKHMWEDVEEKTSYSVAGHIVWGEKYYIKKCEACGMIDDRKKENAKSK